MTSPSLSRYAWLSIGAAVVTIALKLVAALFTGSVSLLSDALESIVNLVAGTVALMALNYAARPPDEDHDYGHTKIEYFSSGLEGLFILAAAASIAFTSIPRLITPQPVEQLSVGLLISFLASALNLAVSRILLYAGRQYHSIALEADGKHLMTDVWTSIGVIIGLILAAITGWTWLDPVIALVVAANIVWTGVQLLRRSTLGLLDTALPEADRQIILSILDRYKNEQGIQTHALRTRQSASRRFISFHVLVPNYWTVSRGHHLLERIESDIRTSLPNATVFTHLEPKDDPSSFEDMKLDREQQDEE
ncbi:MAG: cation transporter [Anaerolineae bacterium]|nr:cation transporter [Anaerolineae bacterium]